MEKLFILLIDLFCVLIICFALYLKVKLTQTEKSLAKVNKQMENLNLHFQNTESFQKKIKIVWHDFNNHIICMSEMLKNCEYKLLGEYFSKICEISYDANKPIGTGNIIFDAIISEKRAVAIKNNIEFLYKIMLPDKVNISPVDLCSILGNILDNSIEACIKIDDNSIKKSIEFNVGFKNDYISIFLKNSAKNIIKNSINLITSKADADLHGIGMKNVEDLVIKWDGNILYELNNSIFELKIILKNLTIEERI